MVHQFNQNFSNSDFRILDYTEFLTPSDIPKRKKENKYICPNCGEHQLSINADGFKYDCYSCGDKSAIASVLRKEYIAKYDYETEGKYKKVVKPKNTQSWTYTSEGKPYIKVTRFDQGNGDKEFYQSRFENDNWYSGLGEKGKGATHFQSKADLLYLNEVKGAMKQDEFIFIVEGEMTCDAVRKLGFVATTNIGGSGKNHQAYEVLKDYPNIVLCPDRDTKGLEHMIAIEQMLNHKPKWLYVYDSWDKLPTKEGKDIHDLILEKKEEKLSNEKIKEVVVAMVGDKKELGKTENKVVKFPAKPIDKDDIRSRLIELSERT